MRIIDLEARQRGDPKPRLTRDGYTKRGGSPTHWEVYYQGRWRRVYELCWSNCPSYIIKIGDKSQHLSYSSPGSWRKYETGNQ